MQTSHEANQLVLRCGRRIPNLKQAKGTDKNIDHRVLGFYFDIQLKSKIIIISRKIWNEYTNTLTYAN